MEPTNINCIIPIGVANNTYMVQKVHFLIICHLLLSFLNCLFYDPLCGYQSSNVIHLRHLMLRTYHQCLCQQ